MSCPAATRVKVRGVQVHGAAQPAAVAGQRVAVNLGGVEVADVARGQNARTPRRLRRDARGRRGVELLPTAKPLRHGARVRFHQGTAEMLGRVSPDRPRRDERSRSGRAARAFVRRPPRSGRRCSRAATASSFGLLAVGHDRRRLRHRSASAADRRFGRPRRIRDPNGSTSIRMEGEWTDRPPNLRRRR